ncbi:MAG: alpha-L-glutamate ligase-like protein [Spirochaetota bacterium]|nr:alpha-L-glutamate ligase-like protein [Spirochaetota bacterium]
MFGLVKRLNQMGILGINSRNADYILKYNKRKLYPLVDDKLLTKQLAIKFGINVPELYYVVEVQAQKKNLHAILEKYDDFVIKPAHGSGGDGILVVFGRTKGMYRKLNGHLLTQDELNYHVSKIISGMYSLGGHPDKALIEYRVKFDPVFEAISYLGVPDVRVIILLGVPVMSMVRLPTRQSDGKANLHQGAIGAGIDIVTGVTLNAVWHNSIVTEHPDTGNSITGINIPNWDALLYLAASCYELTGLGYQGVDIVLDKDKGPMILELNARPGLNIQIANQAGLIPRLELVTKYYKELKNIEARIDFAKNNFKHII